MTSAFERFFERLTGRLPIGWLQLVHNKMRFGAALAGVAFADILILMQLGFMGALVDSIKFPYHQMNADLMLSASDMNTLNDGSPLPRQRMYEALAVAGVKSASPLYYGKIDWKQPDGTIRTLDTFGIDPTQSTFKTAEINAELDRLKLPDMALMDRKTRNVAKDVVARIDAGQPMTFEAKGRTLTVAKLFFNRRRHDDRWLSRRLGSDVSQSLPTTRGRGAEPYTPALGAGGEPRRRGH